MLSLPIQRQVHLMLSREEGINVGDEEEKNCSLLSFRRILFENLVVILIEGRLLIR